MAVFVARKKATSFFPNKPQPSILFDGTSTATQRCFLNINLGSFGFSKVKNYVVEDSGPIFGHTCRKHGNGSSTLLRLSV